MRNGMASVAKIDVEKVTELPPVRRSLPSTNEIFEMFKTLTDEEYDESIWVAGYDGDHRMCSLTRANDSGYSLEESLCEALAIIGTHHPLKSIILIHNYPIGGPVRRTTDDNLVEAARSVTERLTLTLHDYVVISRWEYESIMGN